MSAKRPKYDVTKNPAYITGMKMIEKKKAVQKQADERAKAAATNPKLNPAGKASYEGYVTYFGFPEIRPLADPSARARGAKSNKSRGTQSSATRKIIKYR